MDAGISRYHDARSASLAVRNGSPGTPVGTDAAQSEKYAGYRKELEQGRIATATRSAILMGVVIQNLFLVLDYLAFPEFIAHFFAVRMLINVGFAACYVAAKKYPRSAMIGAAHSLGLGMLALIYADGAGADEYYTGLILVFFGIGVLMPLSVAEALATAGVLAALFAAIPLLTGQPTTGSYGLNTFFVAGAAVETMICSFFLERMRFRDYCQRQQLIEAESHLRELDQAKTRFSANIHHELRTPLTLLLAPLEGLRAGDYGPVSEAFEHTFKTMHVNGQRLLKLINNLLDLAKLESSQFEIRRAPVEIDDVVETIVVGARPMAERKDIELLSSVPRPAPQLFADAEALEKILVNLIGNALKFTEPGGRIEIGVEPVVAGIEVFVRDSGIGLAADQLGRVFDRFAQVDSSATRKHEGTGIGLSLTQELVTLHNGRIWAESDGVGQGTTMRFFLPTGQVDSDEDEPVVVTAETGDVDALGSIAATRAEFANDDFGENAEREAESSPLHFVDLDRSVERWEGQQGGHDTADHSHNDERPEILVADDNEDMRELVSFILSRDFRVRTARNGREAIDLLQGFIPDLVVSDIMMPEMSGTELCQAIKNDSRLAQVPVMLVSSKAESEMKIEGLELGADDYVTKPFHPRELLARARSHAALHRARRDLATQNEALAAALEDLRSAEQQLIQSERLAAVGEIAAGIAHEVNNPVNYALNAARSLSASVGEIASIAASAAALDWNDPQTLGRQGAKLREEINYAGGQDMVEALNELIEIVTNGLDRTRKLVGDLRDFAKPTYGEDAAIAMDLVESVESTLQLVGTDVARAGITIAWEAPSELPEVIGHPAEIGQVVLNLVKNAAEAIGEGPGSITLAASLDGEEVVLRVSDDGPGIPGDIVDSIFEPFFTTKAAGEGTGLGLAVCRKIVAAQGGTLSYEPRRGRGSTFVVTLQACTAGLEAKSDPSAEATTELST